MHFFVTGASGFVGSNFVNELLFNNHKVTALLRPSSNPRVKFIKKVKICRGELFDDWRKEMEGCDIFVHCASEGVVNNHNDWEKCTKINFIQTSQIINNAFQGGINNFIICGSCFEYGYSGDEFDRIPVTAPLKPVGAYGFSKAAGSLFALNFAKENNVKLIIPRFFHLYGRGDHKMRFWPKLVRAAQSGENFEMTLGNQLRNFMRVEEAVKKLLDIAMCIDTFDNGGIVKHIGTDKNMSLLSFAKSEWKRLDAKGEIINGVIPYRNNEVMSYVPEL